MSRENPIFTSADTEREIEVTAEQIARGRYSVAINKALWRRGDTAELLYFPDVPREVCDRAIALTKAWMDQAGLDITDAFDTNSCTALDVKGVEKPWPGHVVRFARRPEAPKDNVITLPRGTVH
jgi:hypothetical protein